MRISDWISDVCSSDLGDRRLKRNPLLLERAREMRSTQTPAERRLWSILRAGRLNGVKFTRQVLIGNFTVDFASRSARLAIEVEGDTHAKQVDYDKSDRKSVV